MMRFRRFLMIAIAICAVIGGGCGESFSGRGRVDKVIGQHGLMPGQFVKPRAIAIDAAGNFAIVDMQAMIQWLDGDGSPLAHWQTPTHRFGRPSGLAIDRDGYLLVADSHYHRVLRYDREGRILQVIGGDEGDSPLVGRFGYISDVACDSKGNIYIAEAQQNDRISKVTADGQLVREWGGVGPEFGQFQKIRALAIDSQDRIYVADACNHRIQVFDDAGHFLLAFGRPGTEPGEMMYPYDVAIGPAGSVFVCEYGNSRVQEFSPEGEPIQMWGQAGRAVGELFNPWAVAVDPKGQVFVVDSNNHRIQRLNW